MFSDDPITDDDDLQDASGSDGDDGQVLLTKGGLKKIKEEYDELKNVRRKEIAERLRTERDVHAWPSTIWQFLDRRGITFKKRPLTRPNRTASMCWQAAEPGSNASSTSIERGTRP